MPGFNLDVWRHKARQLKLEVYALYLAYKDPRTPWYAKVAAACVAGYAFSPIDLIPDPIPLLDYLDDLVILPLGVLLALKLIPQEVMADCRVKAKTYLEDSQPVSYAAAAVFILLWLLAVALTGWWLYTVLDPKGFRIP
jgi:uncharacterized membrane protein YkvA (DUF1232 family)